MKKFILLLSLLTTSNAVFGMKKDGLAIYINKVTGEQFLCCGNPVKLENVTFISEKGENPCSVCFEPLSELRQTGVLLNVPSCCATLEEPHILCALCVEGIKKSGRTFACPNCRAMPDDQNPSKRCRLIPVKSELLRFDQVPFSLEQLEFKNEIAKNKNNLNRADVLKKFPALAGKDIDNMINILKREHYAAIKDVLSVEGFSISNARRNELQNQFQWCNVDHLIDEGVRNMKLVRSMRSTAIIMSLASGLYAILHLYSMLSRTKSVGMLDTSARIAQETLLSLDFDLLNPTDKILSLSKRYDIPAILKSIEDTDLRDKLEKAITEFDVALEATSATITTSYYYHPAAYFLEKEAPLVAQLESAQTQLRSTIDECKRQSRVGYRDSIKSGVAIGLSAACGYYFAKANPLKKWGLF